MHIRPNQLEPSIQLDAIHSAQKAAAKVAAARIRKKLSELNRMRRAKPARLT
jgi:hypothetical protein